MPAPTVERLKELLRYDPKTGHFIWRVARNSHAKKARIGGVAGSPGLAGYVNVGIDGRPHRAHRLAWLYMTGEWPAHEIDHINGNKADNRWANLRAADRYGNTRNARGHRDSLSGLKGVHKKRDKWEASIMANRRKTRLGVFTDPRLAHAVYNWAATMLHGDFARIT